MDFSFDPVWFFLAGHLLHAEQSRVRRRLLYWFARRIEVPLLWASYHGTRGRVAWLSRNALTRAALKIAAVRPFGRYIDTGHPMITDDVLALLDRQDTAIAIGPCRCQVAHGMRPHIHEKDMVIRTGTPAFTQAFPADYRMLNREEAKALIREFADRGLWHMVFVHCPSTEGVNEYAVCNCSTRDCVPFMLNRAFGQDGFPLLRGRHVAHTVPGKCRSCEACLAVCPWEARRMTDAGVAVDAERCFGCGLCARACANGAIELRAERPDAPLRTYQETS